MFSSEQIRSIPLSLYLHWPWCVKKCPYCDFNSHAAKALDGESAYIEAVLADMRAEAERVSNRALTSLFVGGGTPNLMSVGSMERLLTEAERLFGFASDIEITMEANPGATEKSKLADFRALGVNRLSVGVQSFNDRQLKALGRIHSGDVARDFLAEVAKHFSNFNLDLMFALPGQSLDDLVLDLETGVSMGSTHFSCYQLTIEEGTAFAKRVPEGLPDEDLMADMSDVVIDRLAEAGFEHYEVSGYAKPGFQCRHNLNYWTFGDYVAAGAGAHGKVTHEQGVVRSVRESHPKRYVEGMSDPSLAVVREPVESANLPFEFMLNALRLEAGFSLTDFECRTAQRREAIEKTLKSLSDSGLLMREGDRITLTTKGHFFLSDVQAAFLP